MPPRLSKGKRVESNNDAAKKFGNIVNKGSTKGTWLVRWDNVAECEERARSTIKLVDATAALSPATARTVARAAGAAEEEDGEEDHVDQDSSSSSDEEDAAAIIEDANPHAQKRRVWEQTYHSLIGEKVQVFHSVYVYYFL